MKWWVGRTFWWQQKVGLGWSVRIVPAENLPQEICHRAIETKGKEHKGDPRDQKAATNLVHAHIPALTDKQLETAGGTDSHSCHLRSHQGCWDTLDCGGLKLPLRGWIEWLLCQLISQQCLQAANKCVTREYGLSRHRPPTPTNLDTQRKTQKGRDRSECQILQKGGQDVALHVEEGGLDSGLALLLMCCALSQKQLLQWFRTYIYSVTSYAKWGITPTPKDSYEG